MTLLSRLYGNRGLYQYRDLGARDILAHYTELDPSQCEMIGIAHGVDGGQLAHAQDIDLPAPIHWAYNTDILNRATGLKPCLTLAHPWLLMEHAPNPAPDSVLVVGPPPGPLNDQALRNVLSEQGIEEFDILLKARGDLSASLSFWEHSGVGVVTAGQTDPGFYHRLAAIMCKYETVIGCSLSSALVLAASIGAKVRMLSVQIRYFETMIVNEIVTYGGALQRFAQLTAAEADEGIFALANHLLGADLRLPQSDAREAVLDANAQAMRRPIYLKPDVRLKRLRLAAATLTGRPGLLRRSFDLASLKMYLRRREMVLKIKINELDVALHGANDMNLEYVPEPFVRGRNEPGTGL